MIRLILCRILGEDASTKEGIEDILAEYPRLKEEDIRAAIAYGAEMARQRYAEIPAEETG